VILIEPYNKTIDHLHISLIKKIVLLQELFAFKAGKVFPFHPRLNGNNIYFSHDLLKKIIVPISTNYENIILKFFVLSSALYRTGTIFTVVREIIIW
jgi:hypothetical protein